MAQQTDKFDPAGSSTSTQRNNNLNSTVNLKGSDGRIISNTEVPGTKQVRVSKTLTCNDQGLQNVSADFTGDTTNKPASGSFNIQVGSTNRTSIGHVQKIIAGPGIYVSSPNGDGIVTISLEPFRQLSTGTEDYQFVAFTQTDLSKPPAYDNSCFIAVGGISGVANNTGIAARSRDGVNFVEINNPAGPVSMGSVLNIASRDIPGAGQGYVAPITVLNTATNPPTPNGLTHIYGYLGRQDTTSCCWVSDGIVIPGNDYGTDGADILLRGDGPIYCYYTTGSIMTNSLFLQFTQADGTGTNTSTIYRHTVFPSDWTPYTPGSYLNAVSEGNFTGSSFYSAASNLAPANWSNYTIIAADKIGKKLWKSVRNQKTAGTWTNVLTSSQELLGIAYGNGTWVAVGTNDVVYTSTNTTAWTLRQTKISGSNWRHIAYGGGIFVAVGEAGRAAFSEDNGATWIEAQTNTTKKLNYIAFSNELCRFVAVGDDRTIISLKA